MCIILCHLRLLSYSCIQTELSVTVAVAAAGKNFFRAVIGQRLNESEQVSASTAQVGGILSIVLVEASKLSKVTNFSREKGVATGLPARHCPNLALAPAG